MKKIVIGLMLVISAFVFAQDENTLGGIVKNKKGDVVKFVCENADYTSSEDCRVAISIEIDGVESNIPNSRIEKVFHDMPTYARWNGSSLEKLRQILFYGNEIIRNRKFEKWSQDYHFRLEEYFSNPLEGFKEPGAWLVFPALPVIVALTVGVMAGEGIIAPVIYSIRDGITVIGQPSIERGLRKNKLLRILNFLGENIGEELVLRQRHFNRFIYLIGKINY